MTATPGSAALLAGLLPFIRAGDVSKGEPSFWFTDGAQEVLARLAAKPDEDGVRRPRAFLDWAADIFGPVALERRERLTRFVEEALELAAAERMPISLLEKLIDRVWASPQGETPKELGQAQACLETFAYSIGLSADKEAAREFARVQSIPREEWTRRHDVKVALGIALSTTGEPKR